MGPLISMIMVGASDLVDQQMRGLLATKGDRLAHYHRFQPRINAQEKSIDDTSEINLHVLKLLAENLIRDDGAKLNEVVNKLQAL